MFPNNQIFSVKWSGINTLLATSKPSESVQGEDNFVTVELSNLNLKAKNREKISLIQISTVPSFCFMFL